MTETSKTQPAVLLLEDGKAFYGKACGIAGTVVGEICFNTGMTGYQEVFTDPSYSGQLLVTTNVHIGNYGIADEDTESERIMINGLICKTFNIDYSRHKAQESIQNYFEKEQLIGICDVDTRAIVSYIRDKGAMNAIISSDGTTMEELKKKLTSAPSMAGLEIASTVSTKESYFIGHPDAPYRIAVMDFGCKRNILECLASEDCYLKVFPAKTGFEEIQQWNPDAYFLSNGPGDPATMDYAIETAQKMLASRKPLFGICLGHQILALAMGVSTYKMHSGHRGNNQPVLNLTTGLSEITCQNHGFSVSKDDILAKEEEIEVTHINLNDNTIEGIRLKNYPAFSVQYHPEASPGPHDARYLFRQFVDLIRRRN